MLNKKDSEGLCYLMKPEEGKSQLTSLLSSVEIDFCNKACKQLRSMSSLPFVNNEIMGG